MKPKTDAELLKEYLTDRELSYYGRLNDTNPDISMYAGEVISDTIERLIRELHEAKEKVNQSHLLKAFNAFLVEYKELKSQNKIMRDALEYLNQAPIGWANQIAEAKRRASKALNEINQDKSK